MTLWITIAGWTLVHFLWEGAAIAGAAAVGLALLRAATPQVRYVVATAALALMLLSPLATATWQSSAPTHSDTESLFAPAAVGPVDASAPPRLVRGSSAVQAMRTATSRGVNRMFPTIVSLWGAGVVVLLLRLLGGWWRVRRLQRIGLATPPSSWQGVADRMADSLRLVRRVHVIESSAVTTPAIVGWWRPVLLLPLTGLTGLTPRQAEMILAHELVHVRRHDYLVNILQRVTETVLFYHPAVWWVSHRMRIEREQCCDAVVVRVCGNAEDYATALLRLEEERAMDGPVLAVAANGGALLDRIRRILSPQPTDGRPLAPAVATGVTMLLCALLVTGGYRRSLRAVEARAQTANAAAIVATVNGEPITQADVDHFRPLHGEPANTPLDRVLVQLVDERILVQRGRALGFVMGPDELRGAFAAVKANNHIANDAALDAQLAKQRLTRADLEQHLLRSRLVFRVGLVERDKMTITDDEAQQYFYAHIDEFPLQTFELAKPALVDRLNFERLGRGMLPESYIKPLRSGASIVWNSPELQRAYSEGLTRTEPPPAQSGTPVPGRIAAPTPAWQATASEHFDIFATPDVAGQIARVQQAAERAYRHVSGDLRHDLDVRPSLVLFATGAAARAANGATLPTAGTSSRRTLLPLDQSESALETTVTHEIAHTFAFDIVPGATLAAAPAWIMEGLSEHEGGAWTASDRTILRDLVRTNAAPALTMVDAGLGQGNPRLLYSLGHAAFDFIAARWGADGIRQLLLALRNGAVDRQTLYMTALGVGADEVDRAFAGYLREQFALPTAASPELPECLEDAGLVNVDFKDVTILQVLTLLARPCGVDVRVDRLSESETSRVQPRIQFNQTKLSEVFRFLVVSAGWRATAVDQTTVVLAR